MNKKQKVEHIRPIFAKEYPEAECSLDYRTPFELLVSVILAAQCTDARVNIVTKDLFQKYKSVRDFANARQEELEQDIRSTGFFRNKAKNIIACANQIIRDFDGQVPDNMEDLLTLSGVGRKTGNLILGDVYGKPALVIDTHAKRITKLIGLTKNTDPTKIEFDLMKFVPPDYQSLFCHQLVLHGRAICIARRPKCDICPILPYCGFGLKNKKEKEAAR